MVIVGILSSITDLNIVANTFVSSLATTIIRLYTFAGSNDIVYEGAQWTKFELWIHPGLLSNENAR